MGKKYARPTESMFCVRMSVNYFQISEHSPYKKEQTCSETIDLDVKKMAL